MSRRGRRVSAEEKALWDRIAEQAEPMHPKTTFMKEAEPKPAPKRPPPRPIRPFDLGSKVDHQRDHDLLPSLSQSMKIAPLQMDAKAHGRLKRGKLKPEARIDLHGMTQNAAHPALLGFVLSEHAAGSRLILVITGKGRAKDYEAPMPVRHGILRHQVPQWLRLPPLRDLVLQVTPANIRHGGEGAYYVYLRRSR